MAAEKPQEAQISLWKAVEGLEGQIATLEAENAALRAAQHGKGQGMPNDSNTQAVQQAEYIALMAARLSDRVKDFYGDGEPNGRGSFRTREHFNRMITQMRDELLELKNLL